MEVAVIAWVVTLLAGDRHAVVVEDLSKDLMTSAERSTAKADDFHIKEVEVYNHQAEDLAPSKIDLAAASGVSLTELRIG